MTVYQNNLLSMLEMGSMYSLFEHSSLAKKYRHVSERFDYSIFEHLTTYDEQSED